VRPVDLASRVAKHNANLPLPISPSHTDDPPPHTSRKLRPLRSDQMLPTRSLSLLLVLAPLFAQVDRGTLSGVVTDSASAAVPAARIKVLDPSTGFARETLTDATGAYRFSALPIGAYTVTVGKEGFATSRAEDLRLAVGVARTLDFQLQIGQIATQVEVNATATPLEQNNADIGSVVEAKQIRNIPINGRNWNFLMMLAPGAVNTGEGTQNSIRFFGRSRDENNWTYDGVDATGIKDPRQEGGPAHVITLDSLAEVCDAV